MKLAIYIPAYNAAHTVALVLDRIPAEIKDKVQEIFIVDNASVDSTYLTIVGYKVVNKEIEPKLTYIKNEKNLNYGGSQKLAYRYCIDKGYDAVVMLHGDAQYAPEEIPKLLEPIEKGEADLVYGSRIAGHPIKGGMALWRYFGNRVLTIIENIVLGLNLSEFHSGYRIYSCKALEKIPFDKCSDDMHFDSEILIQFRLAGLRIAEKPIPTHYGKESHSPGFFHMVRYGLNILWNLCGYLLHKWGIKKQEKFEVGE